MPQSVPASCTVRQASPAAKVTAEVEVTAAGSVDSAQEPSLTQAAGQDAKSTSDSSTSSSTDDSGTGEKGGPKPEEGGDGEPLPVPKQKAKAQAKGAHDNLCFTGCKHQGPAELLLYTIYTRPRDLV